MYHNLPRAASFWLFLLTIDQDLAEAFREQACPCGGRLHRANYVRKPRGTPKQLTEPQCLRFSFCCDREGCRKRATPPSVRFLGRKVFLGVIVILVSAMRQGPKPRRVRELAQRFAVDRRTIARWQVFWREHFPQTPFWKTARGRLKPADTDTPLPLVLLDAFVRRHAPCADWGRLLCFLAPITVPGALRINVS
jgi:hypothetical protein